MSRRLGTALDPVWGGLLEPYAMVCQTRLDHPAEAAASPDQNYLAARTFIESTVGLQTPGGLWPTTDAGLQWTPSLRERAVFLAIGGAPEPAADAAGRTANKAGKAGRNPPAKPPRSGKAEAIPPRKPADVANVNRLLDQEAAGLSPGCRWQRFAASGNGPHAALPERRHGGREVRGKFIGWREAGRKRRGGGEQKARTRSVAHDDAEK